MFLTSAELVELTHRQRSAAQARVLCFMGIEHLTRPDGSLAVSRAHVNALLGDFGSISHREAEPNWSAM